MEIARANEFGRALCDHFGLPAGQVLSDIKINAARDEIFSVTLTLALKPEDLIAIGERMKQQTGVVLFDGLE